MKKIFVPALFLFWSFSLFSQSPGYKPGLLVTHAGDTLRGLIDYHNWRINPGRIKFKPGPDAPPAVYTVADASFFEVTGFDAYKRSPVVKDMRPVTFEEVNQDTKDTLMQDTVFLRVLVRGRKYSLYQLIDSKEHYYLQQGDGEPAELSYKLYFDAATSQTETRYIFRDELKRLAMANSLPALLQDIDRARYTERSLSRIAVSLNGNAPVVISGLADNKTSGGSGFFLSAGVNATRLATHGTYPIVGMNYNTGIAPVFALGVDLLNNRNFGDFALRFEVAYAQNTYQGEVDRPSQYNGDASHQTFTLEQRNITPALSVLYNFYRRRKSRFYVGAGGMYNISSYGTNRYVLVDETGNYPGETDDNYAPGKKSWTSLLFRLGARLDDHWEIGAIISSDGSIIDYHVFWATPTIYSLRVSWFPFNKPKK